MTLHWWTPPLFFWICTRQIYMVAILRSNCSHIFSSMGLKELVIVMKCSFSTAYGCRWDISFLLRLIIIFQFPLLSAAWVLVEMPGNWWIMNQTKGDATARQFHLFPRTKHMPAQNTRSFWASSKICLPGCLLLERTMLHRFIASFKHVLKTKSFLALTKSRSDKNLPASSLDSI